MAKKSLCDSCVHDFTTCKARKILFGVDEDPKATGKEADKVISCEGYKDSEV